MLFSVTVSSSDSVNSTSPDFPPSAQGSCLLLAMRPTSNSSDSRCSGRAYLSSNSAPLYQAPEPVFIQYPQGIAGAPYEPSSSTGDNMIYSEVKSTTDMENVDNEAEDVDRGFDFDNTHSSSGYGQISPTGRLNFSLQLARNQLYGDKANHHHSPAPTSPKLFA